MHSLDLAGVTLAFDLDGTLIHTAPDLIQATNDIIARRGLGPVGDDVLLAQISYGARQLIETALAYHRVDASRGEVDQLFEAFLEHYVRHISRHSLPFPGILEILDQAAAAGARVVVCTNKRADMTRKLLDDLDMTRRFHAIAGRDTYDVCKPHPFHLTEVIREAGGQTERAVMVGDSETDVATAKAANIPIIGVTFGYTSIPITELDCDAVIDDYAAFPSALGRILMQLKS